MLTPSLGRLAGQLRTLASAVAKMQVDLHTGLQEIGQELGRRRESVGRDTTMSAVPEDACTLPSRRMQEEDDESSNLA